MNAFRFRGATRRLLAGFVAVLAVALCLGVLSTPSWAEEPATSQVKVDASSQVERSVDVVSPDPASGSDTDISRTDVADGAADSAAPEPDASSQQAFIGEAASSEDAGTSSQMFPAGSSVTSDPSQVPEYDVAADAEPEGSSAPMGYGSAGDSAANAPVAYSATVYSGDWSYYESKDDSGNTVYVLDGYYGSASSITLPAKLDGKQIYGVNFYGGGLPKTVTSVTFPATIKEIGASCFSYTKVSKITFPSNSQLVCIGECAFENTPITSFGMRSVVRPSRASPLALTSGLSPTRRSLAAVSPPATPRISTNSPTAITSTTAPCPWRRK